MLQRSIAPFLGPSAALSMETLAGDHATEFLKLQRPLADDALRTVARGERYDGAPRTASDHTPDAVARFLIH